MKLKRTRLVLSSQKELHEARIASINLCLTLHIHYIYYLEIAVELVQY
jgi:hypothetical protein